jgi:hypothetical protein
MALKQSSPSLHGQTKMLLEFGTSGAAVCAATFCTNPIDVVKVRVQLATSTGMSPGLVGTASSILRNEGTTPECCTPTTRTLKLARPDPTGCQTCSLSIAVQAFSINCVSQVLCKRHHKRHHWRHAGAVVHVVIFIQCPLWDSCDRNIRTS